VNGSFALVITGSSFQLHLMMSCILTFSARLLQNAIYDKNKLLFYSYYESHSAILQGLHIFIGTEQYAKA